MGNEPFITINVWTCIFTIVNLLILMFVMKKLLYKPVKKMLKARQEEIEQTYAQADDAAKTAENLKTEYEAHLAQTRQETNALMAAATRKAQARSDEIVQEANRKAEDLVDKANERIERAKKQAVEQAKREISDMAVLAAERIVESSLDEQEQTRLVEAFIDELDKTDPQVWS